MTLSLDPGTAPALVAAAGAAAGLTLPERGDARGLRAVTDMALAANLGALPEAVDVKSSHHVVTRGSSGRIPSGLR